MKIWVHLSKIYVKSRLFISTSRTLFKSEECMKWRFRGFSKKKKTFSGEYAPDPLRSTQLRRLIHAQLRRDNDFHVRNGTIERLERLRSRLFGISREPRTSRSHVTTALASGLQFEVHVFTARPRSRGK